jgi:hypothetical protein
MTVNRLSVWPITIAILLLTALPAAAQPTQVAVHPGKVRIASTAADALCLGSATLAPASSACTGGAYMGPLVATQVTVAGVGIVNTSGKIPAITSTYFALLSFDAANLTGSVADARLSANVPLLNAANVFTNGQTVSGDGFTSQKDGSDSAGGGPFFGFRNVAGSNRWLAQLGVSGQYRMFYFNGSSWTDYFDLSSGGLLTIYNDLVVRAANTTTASITIGGTPSVNASALLKFIGSNSATNWMIGVNEHIGSGLEFTPSTAGGGSTFTTPLMQLSVGGLLIVSGFGTHAFGAGGTGANDLRLDLLGSSASGQGPHLNFVRNATSIGQVGSHSAVVGGTSNAVVVYGPSSDGVEIMADHASGQIRFYAGGAGEVVRIHASSGMSVGDTTDPGATNFRVAGTSTLVGSVGTLKHGDGSFSAPSVTFVNGTGIGLYNVNGDSTDLGIAVNGQKFADVYLSNSTFKFEIASRSNGTGAVAGNSVVIGKNNSGNTAAGCLAYVLKTSGTAFLWSDTTGVLRIGTSGCPTENNTSISDTGGTIVGTQTSTLDSKLLIAPFTNTRHALDVVAGAPLWRFTYKQGIAGEFVGVMSNTTPELMMDPSPEHPEGRSFSSVSAFGYTAAAIAELKKQIEQVRNPFARLFLAPDVLMPLPSRRIVLGGIQ